MRYELLVIIVMHHALGAMDGENAGLIGQAWNYAAWAGECAVWAVTPDAPDKHKVTQKPLNAQVDDGKNNWRILDHDVEHTNHAHEERDGVKNSDEVHCVPKESHLPAWHNLVSQEKLWQLVRDQVDEEQANRSCIIFDDYDPLRILQQKQLSIDQIPVQDARLFDGQQCVGLDLHKCAIRDWLPEQMHSPDEYAYFVNGEYWKVGNFNGAQPKRKKFFGNKTFKDVQEIHAIPDTPFYVVRNSNGIECWQEHETFPDVKEKNLNDFKKLFVASRVAWWVTQKEKQLKVHVIRYVDKGKTKKMKTIFDANLCDRADGVPISVAYQHADPPRIVALSGTNSFTLYALEKNKLFEGYTKGKAQQVTLPSVNPIRELTFIPNKQQLALVRQTAIEIVSLEDLDNVVCLKSIILPQMGFDSWHIDADGRFIGLAGQSDDASWAYVFDWQTGARSENIMAEMIKKDLVRKDALPMKMHILRSGAVILDDAQHEKPIYCLPITHEAALCMRAIEELKQMRKNVQNSVSQSEVSQSEVEAVYKEKCVAIEQSKAFASCVPLMQKVLMAVMK